MNELWSKEEVNAAIAIRNEVRYERNQKSAEAWIVTATATEIRNGRPNTSFRIAKMGRQIVVHVTRISN